MNTIAPFILYVPLLVFALVYLMDQGIEAGIQADHEAQQRRAIRQVKRAWKSRNTTAQQRQRVIQ